MTLFKACPRCGGDVVEDLDTSGLFPRCYMRCFQCGRAYRWVVLPTELVIVPTHLAKAA